MVLSEVISLTKERLKSIYTKEEIDAIAMLLCKHFWGISKASYYTSKQTTLSDSYIPLFLDALDKLRQHCPIQYVLGETSFYGYTFKVNESVLIPRPETEELVNWICTDYKNSSQVSILDIGTGSGAIAISLAKNLPFACITAIDISADALKAAQANASLNNATISFLEEDIFHPSTTLTGKRFNIIVSNPPYVRESEKRLMNPNVLSYEPDLALFVPDNDPLKYYKAIASFALQHT
jgi:release factor glutamine methyltransferase